MSELYSVPDRQLEPPEPEECGHCSCCTDPIYVGDEIVEYDGDVYHEDCFLDNAAAILFDRCGAMHKVAEIGDWYDG